MVPMKQVTILTVIGSILVVLSSVFIGVFPVIFNSIVDKMLVVREDSSTLKDFITPPVPIYMQFYLFNVTNPDAIRFHGAKPRVSQVGPYTYLEVRTKHNMTWNDEKGTVTYLQDKSYFFKEELSNGLKESDIITTINPIMVAIASKVESLPEFLHALVEFTFLRFHESLFITKKVAELLFKGYDAPLVSELIKYAGDPTNSKGKFGFFYPKNNTDDHTYEVNTGAKGLDDYLHVVKWNGSSSLHYWNNTYCDMINGTDGSQYPPEVSKHDVLYLYTSELCRSLYVTYEKDVDVHGIKTYRFIPPKEVLEDPLVNEDNQCFCYPDVDHCLGASMLNMAPCAFDAPIVLSTPHFYQGSQKDIDSIDGLNPQKEEHETFLDVEPKTGVAMRAMKKMQLNIPLRRYGSFPSFKNVPEVIFPIVWVNESAMIDADTASEVKKAIYLPFTIVDAICGTLIVIGLILLLVGALKFARIRRARNQQKL